MVTIDHSKRVENKSFEWEKKKVFNFGLDDRGIQWVSGCFHP